MPHTHCQSLQSCVPRVQQNYRLSGHNGPSLQQKLHQLVESVATKWEFALCWGPLWRRCAWRPQRLWLLRAGSVQTRSLWCTNVAWRRECGRPHWQFWSLQQQCSRDDGLQSGFGCSFVFGASTFHPIQPQLFGGNAHWLHTLEAFPHFWLSVSPPCTVEVSHGNDEAVSETKIFLCACIFCFETFPISALPLAGHWHQITYHFPHLSFWVNDITCGPNRSVTQHIYWVDVYCYCCFLVLVELFFFICHFLGLLEQLEFFPWPFAFISVCVSFTFSCVLQVPHCVISTSWIWQTMAIHTLHRNRLRVFQRLESWQVFMTAFVFRATLNDGDQKIKQLTMWNHKGKESPEAQCR